MSAVIAGTIGGATLLSGYMGADAAEDAARQTAGASDRATEEQRRQFDITQEMYAPYREAGTRALSTLEGYGPSKVLTGQYIPRSEIPSYESYMGTLDQAKAGVPEFNPNINLENDPGYQFRKAEMERQIDRVAAGQGNLLSGNRVEEVIARSGDLASQEYDKAYGRELTGYEAARQREASQYGRGADFYTQAAAREAENRSRGIQDYSLEYAKEQDYLNYLRNLAGTGQQATSQVAQIGTSTANNISQNIVNAGAAQAAGTIGQANAWTNALGGITQLGTMYGMGAFNSGGGTPNYALNAPPGGNLAYTSGGYGGTGMGSWYY